MTLAVEAFRDKIAAARVSYIEAINNARTTVQFARGEESVLVNEIRKLMLELRLITNDSIINAAFTPLPSPIDAVQDSLYSRRRLETQLKRAHEFIAYVVETHHVRCLQGDQGELLSRALAMAWVREAYVAGFVSGRASNVTTSHNEDVTEGHKAFEFWHREGGPAQKTVQPDEKAPVFSIKTEVPAFDPDRAMQQFTDELDRHRRKNHPGHPHHVRSDDPGTPPPDATLDDRVQRVIALTVQRWREQCGHSGDPRVDNVYIAALVRSLIQELGR